MNNNSDIMVSNIKILNDIYISHDFMSEYSGSKETIESFGEEWTFFDHNKLTYSESAANEYFDIFPLTDFKKEWKVVDVGCGTGRWARRISPYVHSLYGVDPSESINVFKNNIKSYANLYPVRAYAEKLPFVSSSIDLVISYGVLHHIKDTDKAVSEISRILKNNGYFLFYFYYNFEQRSFLFKTIFNIANLVRKIISRMPLRIKNISCDTMSILIYIPLIFSAKIVAKIFGEKWGTRIPLSSYRNKNYYIIRNDCRDRFGTPLEKRYSKSDIEQLLMKNGFKSVVFSEGIPFWHGYAVK
ncbi:class I SAM-dependent methyltransferase [Fluviispira multicolorata]|uniref:Methyltransferase domain-containing protein n=1 Tax=Fluviispira multicolorata TaxID=2654512 RepID=A0A833JD67_9BACT|nr:class I SAM-dependent methyltransferase [Fluviispira multicolorata]KAB8028047.1 methyltransferase domain-containing protein [Fluviispira multicolorata]